VRTLNRFVSAVLALVLLVGGVLVAAEIVSGAFGREEPLLLPWDRWYDDATSTAWSDPDVRLACAGLVLAGVLLLVLEAARRRPRAVALTDGTDGVHADLDRRGLEAWLGQRVAEVDGVSTAKATITGSTAQVRAETAGPRNDRLHDELQVAAGRALDRLELAHPLAVKVAVRSTRKEQA